MIAGGVLVFGITFHARNMNSILIYSRDHSIFVFFPVCGKCVVLLYLGGCVRQESMKNKLFFQVARYQEFLYESRKKLIMFLGRTLAYK